MERAIVLQSIHLVINVIEDLYEPYYENKRIKVSATSHLCFCQISRPKCLFSFLYFLDIIDNSTRIRWANKLVRSHLRSFRTQASASSGPTTSLSSNPEVFRQTNQTSETKRTESNDENDCEEIPDKDDSVGNDDLSLKSEDVEHNLSLPDEEFTLEVELEGGKKEEDQVEEEQEEIIHDISDASYETEVLSSL